MFQVCQKLKLLKDALKQLDKNDFSDTSGRVRKARADLEAVQALHDNDTFDKNVFAKEKELLQNFYLWPKQRRASTNKSQECNG